ncbi:MAG: type II toxin-antitoxin system PemK/MazF family toxin [Candidatus Altiarchaeales archaeon]|nr:type II toxin-antitoxin system PemK/MazF family toxin [Candidatus Altiarchaeota archaeon]MBU4265605.1 type II toxin-antitoxin system PemK/MazF family toxin [Candidatus Altiarchaeota archaeon]MBU4406889.1 type II toxin-antitoxin system PemK/MazF family toxin [Candidatus Altiarchaeota archaeon]MCG2783464.1 type II toxin-antitoxin system PemK/MazF family toxin [Candidatus Altiarchaeales archaeon]
MNKGDVWLVQLPQTNGHEQAGTRPVVILRETEANIAVVIPFTSNIQALRFPHTLEIRPSKENGLKDISVALVFQIRAIDKKRLVRRAGKLSAKSLEKVDSMLKKLLGL